MINFNQIEPNLFIGSAPSTHVDLTRLLPLKITSVLSLQSDHDFKSHRINWPKLESAYRYNNIQVHRFPILDFDETDLGDRLAEPITQLHTLLNDGHCVYVHCNAGICRAPATVLGYLCHFRGMSLDEGLAFLRTKRPHMNPYKGAGSRAKPLIRVARTFHQVVGHHILHCSKLLWGTR